MVLLLSSQTNSEKVGVTESGTELIKVTELGIKLIKDGRVSNSDIKALTLPKGKTTINIIGFKRNFLGSDS